MTRNRENVKINYNEYRKYSGSKHRVIAYFFCVIIIFPRNARVERCFQEREIKINEHLSESTSILQYSSTHSIFQFIFLTLVESFAVISPSKENKIREREERTNNFLYTYESSFDWSMLVLVFHDKLPSNLYIINTGRFLTRRVDKATLC